MTTTHGDAPPLVPEERPRRRRRLIALLVSLVVILALLVAADFAARAYGASLIRQKVAGVLPVEDPDTIDVAIGGFSVLAQLATGKLQQVDIGLEELSFQQLTGSADIRLQGVPIDTSKPTDDLAIAVKVPGDQLAALTDEVTDQEVESIVMQDETVRVDAEVELFGISLPVTVGLLPSVDDGDLALTPVTLLWNGTEFTADELREQFGSAVEPSLVPQTLCLAQYVPSIFSLDDASVVGDELVLSFAAQDAALSRSTFESRGTCSE